MSDLGKTLKKILSPYEVEVNPEFQLGKPPKYYPRQCFAKSFDYATRFLDVEGVKLVHGFYDPMLNDPVEHAWVELPNDIIFDGVLQRFYDKKGYYKAYQIKKVVEYTPREALQKMREHDIIGDWDFKLQLARRNLS